MLFYESYIKTDHNKPLPMQLRLMAIDTLLT